MEYVDRVRITTLVDNGVLRRGLMSTWGLSLYVQVFLGARRFVILMDTSGSFDVLLHNSFMLGVDFKDVDAVFISHWHRDHCGSLGHVLPMIGKPVPVYVPSEDIYGIKMVENARGVPVVCSKPTGVVRGVMSTGEIPSGISEHSLLINLRDKGLIVLTGCSHPGIVHTVKLARSVSGVDKVYAVVGGFHISSLNEGLRVARRLSEIGVQLVSPCHCTRDDAKRGIKKVLGERYVENGVGWVFQPDPPDL